MLRGNPAEQHLVPSLAADHHDAVYDEELDALISWTAFIDGEPAARQTLTHLTVISLALAETETGGPVTAEG